MKHAPLLDIDRIPEGKYLYFASDFHLGAPNAEKSLERELKIIRWLDSIKDSAHMIFLVGDIFDFWFEYNQTIPKGFVRFQGKLAELREAGIPIIFFTGNHDMWMFDYFPRELGIPVYRTNQNLRIGTQKILVGHGDGLGPGDYTYKILKRIFANKVCQFLFNWLHPNIGMWIAQTWSSKSRISNNKKAEDHFLGEGEWLLSWCKEQQKKQAYDVYIFGHRHLPIDHPVDAQSRYINLGEWINYCTYLRLGNDQAELLTFEG
ncbi:UDP-2,3-diacylglucosamine diphosphatase [Cytophagales bacterium LB-30]|uniref:UDP-2,3-diacylglucosamine diphosphatase n=1 Tax=Shiella aurantiaca TaxID=3058365 RepID=A0ABT8F3G8_9BACT|nr:UDP-2,3-diacylglucosamine diphosphatase [Shiella aurantiaca]MDN4164819.1 UDP-2,3-diacylglucosamine diphosphatase [Shiella aurantiaca]